MAWPGTPEDMGRTQTKGLCRQLVEEEAGAARSRLERAS